MAGVLLRPKWAGARRDKGAYPQRSVTEEQRSPRPFSAQPFGPQFFWPPASLLVPYRPGRVCSSLAPSGRPKSLAAKHQLFVRHITSLKRPKGRDRALERRRAQEGESPSLAELPARKLKVTA